MESTMKTRLKVGVFVSLGLVLIIFSILILGGGRGLFTKTITLHAHFADVQGLNVGSVVSLTGINIGNVSAIEFLSKQNKLDVHMKINSSFLRRLTQDSRVEIRTQGALGDKFVYVIPGDLSNPPVKDNDTLAVNTGSDLMSIISEKGAQAGRVFDIIAELHKTMKSINDADRIEKIMINLTEATNSFKITAQESAKVFSQMHAETSPKLQSSMNRLDNILSKIDRGEGSLGALINDPTIHDQLKGFFGGSPRKTYMKSLIRSSIEKGNSSQSP